MKVPNFCTISQKERTFSPFRRNSKSSGILFEAFGRNLKTPPPAAVTVPCNLSTEGPVSVMNFGLLDFWRFSPGTQVRFGQIEKPTHQSVQLNKTNILLCRFFILDKYNLSSGKIES